LEICDELVRARISRSHRAPLGSFSSSGERRTELCIMIGTEKRTVLFINLGVWIAALGSATAVAYAATRSPSVIVTSRPDVQAEQTAQADTASTTGSEPASALQPVMYFSEATIVGSSQQKSCPAQDQDDGRP
jgi:hypothetical protein